MPGNQAINPQPDDSHVIDKYANEIQVCYRPGFCIYKSSHCSRGEDWCYEEGER